MDPFAIRDQLAQVLVTAGVANVVVEAPDALVPPAVVVVWEASTPTGQSIALVAHSYAIEVWPATDLTASSHYASRDQVVNQVLAAVTRWGTQHFSASGWSASNELRDLGQETTRIAVVSLQVTEPDIC